MKNVFLISLILILALLFSVRGLAVTENRVTDFPPVLMIDGDLVAWEFMPNLSRQSLTRQQILHEKNWLNTLTFNFLMDKLTRSGEIPPFDLQQASNQIPAERIQSYYSQHERHFSSVFSVNARHIRLKDETEAKRIFRNLQSGSSFRQQARLFSIADDKHLSDSGRLPEIHVPVSPSAESLTLLEKICLFQIPGRVSHPLRINGNWEIILVDARVEKIRSLEDKALKREIARIIARNDRARLLDRKILNAIDTADIKINPAFLDAR